MSNAFWTVCLARLEQELPAQQFNTWIRALELRAQTKTDDSPELVLTAPNRFVMQWVRERYLHRIEQLSEEFFGASVPITLSLGGLESRPETAASPSDSQMKPQATKAPSGDPTQSHIAARGTQHIASALPTQTESINGTLNSPAILNGRKSPYELTRLNPNFTFDNLVTGRANDLARAAAMQVAHNPGTSYNPLFVYGASGLGKTHLIHAIGNAVLQANPKSVVRYIHVEDYFADVLRAYQQKSFDKFQLYYRSLDLLLVDDIQFLGVGNKERTRDEFFHAFNALTESKRQIVITCDTYPKDIQGLEDRLISRFDWGLTVQIEPPELEMRVAILKKKAELDGVNVPDEVAFLIAKNLRSNVRELEGALKRVVAYARFHDRDISVELAREALRDLLAAFNRQITFELIQKTVADYYKIKLSELLSPKRTRNIARPRQVAMYLSKELTPASLPAIGDAFGGRDHTTVLHGCRTISDLRLTDQQLNHDIHVLTQVLRG